MAAVLHAEAVSERRALVRTDVLITRAIVLAAGPAEEGSFADALTSERVTFAAVTAVRALALRTVDAGVTDITLALHAIARAVDAGAADANGAVVAGVSRVALTADGVVDGHEASAVLTALGTAGFGAVSAIVTVHAETLGRFISRLETKTLE